MLVVKRWRFRCGHDGFGAEQEIGRETLVEELREKHRRLQAILQDMGSVVVAFSGGVDSTLLLKVASAALGDRAVGVIGLSDSVAPEEAAEARDLARAMGAGLLEIETAEMADDAYTRNAADRCFHCKAELFGRLSSLARERGYQWVADGANADDLGDYRPGRQAAQQLGVRSPLQEAGLSKAEIRALSRELGLPTWNKPAMACLSSRVPYGESITAEKLRRINRVEQYLRGLGFPQVRVRCHREVARIEVPPEQLHALIRPQIREALVQHCKAAGFVYVTIDLQGYRSGSMNEMLPDTSAAGVAPRRNGAGDGR